MAECLRISSEWPFLVLMQATWVKVLGLCVFFASVNHVNSYAHISITLLFIFLQECHILSVTFDPVAY